MFQNDFDSPQQALPQERIGHGLLLANAQVFHRFPPSLHFEGEREGELQRESFSASRV